MLKRIAHKAKRVWADWSLQRGFRHVHGPKTVTLGPDEAGLVVLARDAEWFLRDCLAHHFALGIRHAVVIDNGSTDRTVAIASAFRNVTVLANPMPAKTYEVKLRSVAATRVFSGGWIAFADADEMLALPAPLPRVLAYANASGHSAILGHMIDLSREDPGTTVIDDTYQKARAESPYYTLDGLEWVPYADPSFHIDWFLRNNQLSDPNVKMVAGGLRKLAFGEDPVLTKHVLVRNAPGVELMTHVHAAGNVVVSDITLAIMHYKLAGDWQRRDKASVAARLWEHGEDNKRLDVSSRAGFSFPLPHKQTWTGTDALLRDGFLYASPKARAALGIA